MSAAPPPDEMCILSLVPQHTRDLILRRDFQGPPWADVSDFGLTAIIDISGYSKLTSHLQTLYGNDGCAKIKELLNPPIKIIIKCVEDAYGSVVKFSGDAVIATWNSLTDGSALEIKSQPLKIHIGLGFGKTSHIHVGDSKSRIEYFIAGESMKIAAGMLANGGEGELAFNPELMLFLSRKMQAEVTKYSQSKMGLGIKFRLISSVEEDLR
ncbi:Adenylate cyclase type 10 [Podochytrium sp. JEL0797]|nr:Adenylate cyclase type 10 [Podochytrium sp. JEL0797]